MNKIFGLNGLLGFFIAVILVVGSAVVLGYIGIVVQQREADNHYRLDTGAIEMKNIKNSQYYKLVKE